MPCFSLESLSAVSAHALVPTRVEHAVFLVGAADDTFILQELLVLDVQDFDHEFSVSKRCNRLACRAAAPRRIWIHFIIFVGLALEGNMWASYIGCINVTWYWSSRAEIDSSTLHPLLLVSTGSNKCPLSRCELLINLNQQDARVDAHDKEAKEREGADYHYSCARHPATLVTG